MQYQEGLKRMIDRQLDQGKKEEGQKRKELEGLFGASVRLRLILAGRVHDVGFRAFVKHQANLLSIKGRVKNTRTGVEVVAEGEKSALETLMALCLKGPPLAKVEDHKAKWENATNDFSAFEIVQ
ncbi:MAG TPA: acylphosphatase [Candidatus Nanoarchaeia archaeon]|nr:acylphosphatase [Candidatus Nanoarchaeia archaeon]